MGAGPGRRRDGGQPADRRRPGGAAPVARRPRARAPQRLRPRRAAGRRLARRGLLARPHRPAVRPRAAGDRVPRRRSRRCRRTSRRCSSASTRAACGRTPTGSASATACASSRSCRCRCALGYQRAADALLLVNGRRPESMSSKVFEYLQAGRPIFAISPAGSAARALFAEVGGGTCVLPDDRMAAPLAAFVAAVRGGEAPVAAPDDLDRYELGRLTHELAGHPRRPGRPPLDRRSRRPRAGAGGAPSRLAHRPAGSRRAGDWFLIASKPSTDTGGDPRRSRHVGRRTGRRSRRQAR